MKNNVVGETGEIPYRRDQMTAEDKSSYYFAEGSIETAHVSNDYRIIVSGVFCPTPEEASEIRCRALVRRAGKVKRVIVDFNGATRVNSAAFRLVNKMYNEAKRQDIIFMGIGVSGMMSMAFQLNNVKWPYKLR